MKIAAVVDADLEVTPLGTRSRQADELHGVPVLRRTVMRVLAAERVEACLVICPQEQADRCRALLDGLACGVRPVEAEPPPYRRLIAAARKWSLGGWRGGMGSAAHMDEYTHPAVLAAVAGQEQAEAVWTCPGAAAAVDPALIDAMLDHYVQESAGMKITFAPVLPGIVGTVFATSLLQELAEAGTPPGWTMSYKPDAPRVDLAFKDCCYPAPQVIRHAAGRLLADTRRGWELLEGLLAEHPEPSGEDAGRWLMGRFEYVPALPREVEFELTTDDWTPGVTLRPRGDCVPRRGPIDVGLVASAARELAEYDDALVVLGGFGEPLLHPQFGDVLRAVREAGVYGIAVRTTLAESPEDVLQVLVETPVDVVNVLLDAWSPELYAELHPGATLDAVRSSIERLRTARAAAQEVRPLVVPQMTKARDNLSELDGFFDGWLREVGWAVIEGFSHHAGRLEDRSAYDMTPPVRTPCRRLSHRGMVLADGSVTLCDQDFKAESVVGRLGESTLGEIWRGAGLEGTRTRHREGIYEGLPLCPDCDEWHRP